MDTEAGPPRRLFYALWPDEGVRGSLDAAAGTVHAICGGRRIPKALLHMTLVFLGATPEAQLPQLLAIGDSIAGIPSFQLRLDHAGLWPRAGVAWVAPTQVPTALGALVEALQEALGASGIRHDVRDYRPHVTLARDARQRSPQWPAFDIAWTVTGFCLVESIALPRGSHYSPLAGWALS
jgi:2'-5' RNA ligase